MRILQPLLIMLGLLSACSPHRPPADQAKVVPMGNLIIQEVGGFAGGGTPGAHFRKEGRLALSDLSPEDREHALAMFANPKPVNANFYYRITLESPAGKQTIEALPEAVPPALIASVKTILD